MHLVTCLLTTPDVTDIKYVINFDFPNNTEDYVHRIGRTARASQKGTSYTFFTSGNAKQAKDLIELLKEANQTINPHLYEMASLARQLGRDRGLCATRDCACLICCCTLLCSPARSRYRVREERRGGMMNGSVSGFDSGRGGGRGRTGRGSGGGSRWSNSNDGKSWETGSKWNSGSKWDNGSGSGGSKWESADSSGSKWSSAASSGSSKWDGAASSGSKKWDSGGGGSGRDRGRSDSKYGGQSQANTAMFQNGPGSGVLMPNPAVLAQVRGNQCSHHFRKVCVCVCDHEKCCCDLDPGSHDVCAAAHVALPSPSPTHDDSHVPGITATLAPRSSATVLN